MPWDANLGKQRSGRDIWRSLAARNLFHDATRAHNMFLVAFAERAFSSLRLVLAVLDTPCTLLGELHWWC